VGAEKRDWLHPMRALGEGRRYQDFQLPSTAAHLDARSVIIPSFRAVPARSGGGAVFAVVRTGCARTVARARACWRHRFPLTSLRSRCWCVQVGAASQGACSADCLDDSSAAGAHRRQQVYDYVQSTKRDWHGTAPALHPLPLCRMLLSLPLH